MKSKPSNSHLISVPWKMQLTIFLIREELKSRKFFASLRQVGLDYSYYQPHLDRAILQSIGLDAESDEVFDLYYRLLEKRCAKIRMNNRSVMRQALKVYRKLLCEKERAERGEK